MDRFDSYAAHQPSLTRVNVGVSYGRQATRILSAIAFAEADLTLHFFVSTLALELLASSMDHDELVRAEIEKGRATGREGTLLENDDVAARMDRRYRG